MKNEQFDRMHERYFPRITRAQRAAAIERLKVEREKHILIDWGNGPQPFYTGTIDVRDVRAESGYGVVIEGFDRFGWPVGHPESPARA